MPQKIRQLEADLVKAGFIRQPGKGSHRHYIHPDYRGKITLSGQPGDDADRYQEKAVRQAIQAVQKP